MWYVYRSVVSVAFSTWHKKIKHCWRRERDAPQGCSRCPVRGTKRLLGARLRLPGSGSGLVEEHRLRRPRRPERLSVGLTDRRVGCQQLHELWSNLVQVTQVDVVWMKGWRQQRNKGNINDTKQKQANVSTILRDLCVLRPGGSSSSLIVHVAVHGFIRLMILWDVMAL